MRKSTKCSPEVRERAVRMVQEHRGEYPSLWAAIELIAPKIGCVPQTLHEWVRKQEIDTGMREGTTSEERDRIEALGREVKELRRANEILNRLDIVDMLLTNATPTYAAYAPRGMTR
jgi:transposase